MGYYVIATERCLLLWWNLSFESIFTGKKNHHFLYALAGDTSFCAMIKEEGKGRDP